MPIPPEGNCGQVATDVNLLRVRHKQSDFIPLDEVKAEPRSAQTNTTSSSGRSKETANVADAAVAEVRLDPPGPTPPGFKPEDAKWPAQQCTKCTISNPRCYWDHGPDKGKSFLQVLKRSCRRRLVLNDLFFDSFRSAVSEVVRLRLRSGEYYNVNVVTQGYRCVLEKGWDLLCKDHKLKGGDMAVFTYYGPSEFHLRLFDHGGIELISSFVRPLGCPGQESQKSHCPGIQKKYVLSRNVVPTKELDDAIAAVGHGDLPSYVFRITETNINTGVLVRMPCNSV